MTRLFDQVDDLFGRLHARVNQGGAPYTPYYHSAHIGMWTRFHAYWAQTNQTLRNRLHEAARR